MSPSPITQEQSPYTIIEEATNQIAQVIKRRRLTPQDEDILCQCQQALCDLQCNLSNMGNHRPILQQPSQ